MIIQNTLNHFNSLNVSESLDMVNMDQLSNLDDVSSLGFVSQGLHGLIDPINSSEIMMNNQVVGENFLDQGKLVEFQNVMREYSTNVTIASKVVGISIKSLNELLHPQ